jgi:hypothetical protein
MSFLSSQSKLFAGLLCLALVTVEYGGHFLLSILKGTIPDYSAASPQFPFFRAGHAHAGVWVMAQPLIDTTRVSDRIKLLMRILFFASPLLISGGFFAGALTMADGKPGALHWLIYAGLATLAVALVLLGVNLIRDRG